LTIQMKILFLIGEQEDYLN